MGRSFHRPGTVKENVLESDFEPLCDGTTRRRSLADLPAIRDPPLPRHGGELNRGVRSWMWPMS